MSGQGRAKIFMSPNTLNQLSKTGGNAAPGHPSPLCPSMGCSGPWPWGAGRGNPGQGHLGLGARAVIAKAATRW